MAKVTKIQQKVSYRIKVPKPMLTCGDLIIYSRLMQQIDAAELPKIQLI